ncbi:MAG TPA: hypothetical protein VMV74_11165 [Bacteroidales bacterium]|nr:hypothetical protein [Bacteroidales bacterium]
MKKTLLIGAAIIVTLTSCERISYNPDQYLFRTSNGIKYKYSDFELYDSSTHILYLKSKHPEFKSEKPTTFSLLANGEEIYTGVFWSTYSSSLPIGPYISSFSSFYPDFTIRIEHMIIDNKPKDPRNDPRIISALKDHNLLHSGLSVLINSIDIVGTELTFKFTVTNLDESNLLILDPDKTGPKLFHYFTNGLRICELTYEEVFAAHIVPEAPSPRDSWERDWLSELKPGESRQFTIIYAINSGITPGEYYAMFEFPGLTHGVTKKQLFQDDARIWLGDIFITQEITFPIVPL